MSADRGPVPVRARLRVFVALCRPPVVLLFALITSLGLTQGGRPGDLAAAGLALVPVMALLVFAVAVNDLSDEAIDRVNLPHDRRRPLVSGLARRTDMVVVAGAAAVIALASAARLGLAGLAVTAVGIAFSTAYSLEPLRLAKRGVVASISLPLGYVAVPFTLGVLAAGGRVRPVDLAVLGSLYVAFIGRLVLKDFRDVRGDELFGKRTFLVRHGRRSAVVTSAVGSVVGAVGLIVATEPTLASAVTLGGLTAAAVVVLVRLDRSSSARRDEALVAAAAIVGRGALTLVLAHGSVRAFGWTATSSAVALVAVAVVTVGAAHRMARLGPRTSLVLSDAMVAHAAATSGGSTTDAIHPTVGRPGTAALGAGGPDLLVGVGVPSG